MKLSVVIPNYNGKDLLEKNLPKVIKEITKLRNYEIEVIIVDDGSTDGSIEELKAQSSKLDFRPRRRGRKLATHSRQATSKNLKLKTIANKENLGFSSTINKGVEEAKGELVVLLNTDVHPEKGFLDAVFPHFKNPKVFAVGMLDRSIEGEKIVRRGRGMGEWKRGMYIHKRGEVNRTDTAWVSGGSGVFRKSIWKKLGGFDAVYNPFYWEDIDLSFRAKKAGYKILFEPKSVIFHEHGKGIIKSNYSPQYIKTISYRNQFLFVWKNAPLGQLLAHILWLPSYIFKSILTGDICFMIGLLWAIERRLVFR